MSEKTTIKKKLALEPQFDKVLLKRVDQKKTEGGILLPDNAEFQPLVRGTIKVRGVGDRTMTGEVIDPQFDEGDRVMFWTTGGAPMRYCGEVYYAVKETVILGKLSAEAPARMKVELA